METRNGLNRILKNNLTTPDRRLNPPLHTINETTRLYVRGFFIGGKMDRLEELEEECIQDEIQYLVERDLSEVINEE